VLDSGSLLSVPLWQQGAARDQQVFNQLTSRCIATTANVAGATVTMPNALLVSVPRHRSLDAR
jgi:hypothetical protein